ncbi:MAG TPA: acylase, partial [Longimicrobiaceae bacterium]|nr:acylase [Longimicrobiaceae bacterium]
MRTFWRSLALVCLLANAPNAAAVAQSGRAAQSPRAEILWDRWGIPHVYAKDHESLVRAFGWAQAESHGDLLLRMYGQARGRAAEYWGERFLDSDRTVRTMGIPGRAREWYRAQSPAGRRRLDAFAAGINAYAAAHPDLIADRVEAVLPVTGEDVLAHVQRVIHFTFLGDPTAVAERIQGPPAGSNAWAVAPSRSASGNALLLANPHLPWSDVFTWYEAQLVGPGVDVYGAALVGFPFVGIGFNDFLGWTHTVNTLDGADVYALTLAEGGYRWDGGVRPFETRREVIRVRGSDGTQRDDTLMVRASVHGPVLGERDGNAFAYRVAGLDQPFMVDQYWEMARARNLKQFEGAVGRLQMPMFTVMYADRDGHVLHLFNGRVPVRSRGGWEHWQGAVRGDTSATLWTRTHAYAELPRVLDPASGWLQNANDPPWTTTFPAPLRPDAFPEYMAPRGMEFRPQHSAKLVMADSSISLEEMIAYKHSTRMELADRVLDDLLAAVRERGTPASREAAAVLERWDHATDAESRGGVLFLAWAQEMAQRSGGNGLFATGWD